MALSENRIVYGIHSIVPYRRSDHLPYGILKVLGGGTLALSAEYEDLFGGSNRFAWASEPKTISSEFTASVKSMPDFLFELFLGASVATTAASATGTATTIANVKGTSAVASTGIASVDVKTGSESDLKFGKYVVKVASATTVDVYKMTDLEGDSFVDDELLVVAGLTITQSAAVEITGHGLELTGDSGTIAMTIGDTAEFHATAAHGGISTITLGQSAGTFAEHGQVCLSQKRSNGDLFEIEIFKAVGAGFPIALEETVFAIPELTIKLLYDEDKDAIAQIRAAAHA